MATAHDTSAADAALQPPASTMQARACGGKH